MTSKGTSVASMAKGDMESFFSDKFEAEDIKSDELNIAIDQERQLVDALRKLRDASKTGTGEAELARLHEVQ